MRLFDRMIRAIERNSRANERRRLTRELDELYADREYADARIPRIVARLEVLGKADLDAYLNRGKQVRSVSDMVRDDLRPEHFIRPVKSVSQMVQEVEDAETPYHHWHGYGAKRAVIEDDCGVPDGLVGEWKGPA